MSQPSHYQTVNPATGKVEASFRTLLDSEVLELLNTAQNTYTETWRALPPAERAKIVRQAACLLRERKDEVAGLATREMGKLIDESYGEVEISAQILEYYADHAEAFLKSKPLPDAPGCEVITQPFGVILAIEPWNFPYYQLARVAGPQLVAGNVVMVKHAHCVPQCALAFEKLFTDIGAPKGVWTNLFCNSEQAGMLIKDFRVRGVTLTGSERAGAAVAAQAGQALKKVVLELGGSDPFIILPDADLAGVIPQAAAARLSNNGEECTSSKRIIVVGKGRGEKVVQGMKRIFEGLKVGDPTDPSTKLGPIVNEGILKGLLRQVADAKKAGARIITGGHQLQRPGFYMAPTVITDITPSNPLFQQEAFGPVASIYVVDTEDQAIELANATTFGLGASVHSADIAHAREVAARIESGMVFINSSAISSPQLPFGGVKNSGFGRELSEYGFGEFVNRKLISVTG